MPPLFHPSSTLVFCATNDVNELHLKFAVNSHFLASIVQLLEFLKTLRKKAKQKGLNNSLK